jgi:hypothetical protein
MKSQMKLIDGNGNLRAINLALFLGGANMSYVNITVKKLRSGGRKAPKVTIDFLKKKIFDLMQKYEPEEYTDITYFCENNVSPYGLTENKKIESDLGKVVFDFENYEFDTSYGDLCGFHTLDNGFTFLGGFGGGDWEFPVFFIVYWDGKALRGYIPVCGNTYNLDLNTAFGSEEESDKYEDWVAKVEAKLYPNSADDDSESPVEENLIKAYCDYHGYVYKDDEELDFHWKGIETDIKNRIEVAE